jgi:hypothetical protein
MKSIILAVSMLGSIPAFAGNFSGSCSQLRIAPLTLTAQCADTYQVSWPTTLQLRGIENKEGRLTQEAISRPSTFQKSCRAISLSASGVLHATCKQTNGSWVNTTLDLNTHISNHNGSLVYDM